MDLHDKIKKACADLCALLCRETSVFREALQQRGVRVTIDPPPRPNKAA